MSKTSDWLLDPEREHDESICYDDDLPIYEAAMGAALEARGLEAENAELRVEVETLKMLLPVVGSITFPPKCVEFPLATTIADLRDRLSLFAGHVCQHCGCAPCCARREHCLDCWEVRWNYGGVKGSGYHVASCLSVGLRALCGRRLIDVGEVK